jgi:hypothetical protein
MSIIDKLASSLNRRDETPNVDLAKKIAAKKDNSAIRELIDNLSNKNKNIQNDCIKVLYEIGEINASLIAPYSKEFIKLLSNKNNRLQWGAMTALNTIVPEKPKDVHAALPKIMAAAQKGSVITNDYAVNILVRLGSIKQYEENVFPLLNELIFKSPVNQLPTYAEKALPYVNAKNKNAFLNTLNARLHEVEQDTKRKRLEKVIQKVNKMP